MQLRTFDELTPSQDVDRLLVHLSSLGGATNRRSVDLWRRRSDLYSDYAGIFAVEGGTVVGQTYVKRLPYTFRTGTEPISAIASVGTRPDLARTGIAGRILEEVHRRERAAGLRYAALWTNPSWGAHRLYEKLGYRDVYVFPWAVRGPRPARGSGRAPRGIRPARDGDLAELERLHDRWAEGRLGFCRRPKRLLRTAAEAHEIDPASEIVVGGSGGRIAGYASLQANPYRLQCGELVATSASARAGLLAELERRAKGLPVVVQGSPVVDAGAALRARGYRVLPTGWWVFMAKDLEGPWDPRTAVETFATDDPRFLCLSGDRF